MAFKKGCIPWNKGTRDPEKARERQRRYDIKPEARAKKNARQKAVRAAQPQTTRDYYLKRHGISQADYDRILAAQKNCCAICFRRAETGQFKKLKVDHDHKTGRIRGLLCHHCNVALGHFGDDLLILELAMGYLQNGGQWLEDWWLL